MKVNAKELRSAIARAKPIFTGKKSMPILGHVLLSPADGVLSISATDLTVYYSCKIPFSGEAFAPTCVSAKEILAALPSAGAIDITPASDAHAIMVDGIHLDTFLAEDFPARPEFTANHTPCSGMSKALQSVKYAASKDVTRFNLETIFFQNIGGQLRLVATDGHRAVWSDTEIEADYKAKANALLPATAAGILSKQPIREYSIQSGGITLFLFRAGASEWVIRGVDAEFPDYKAIIPKDMPHYFIANVAELRDVCRTAIRLAGVARQRYAPIEFRINGKTTAKASAFSRVLSIHDTNYQGPESAVAVQSNYILDALSVYPNCGCEKVTVKFTDAISQVMIGNNVIMPVRV